MTIKNAKALWLDAARFYLERVKLCDRQTVEDVLALLQWPAQIKNLQWAMKSGPGQVFTSAVMNANVTFADLQMLREESERRAQRRQPIHAEVAA